jgi:hypothetical protein
LDFTGAQIAFAAAALGLAGICGMGGPPLVLWAMAHDWPADKVRAFLFACFAATGVSSNSVRYSGSPRPLTSMRCRQVLSTRKASPTP